MRHLLTRTALAALVLCVSSSASALSVTRFSPEGMMARIARVQADFDVPAVSLGNDGAADPFLISCDDDAVKGSGRWTDPQHWIYVFAKPLAGAVSCQARPNPDFRDVQGQPLAGDARRFATGGPRARLVRPWGRTISEDQVFVLRFNAAPDTKSLLEHAYCEVEGLGEAVPTRLVTGVDRELILKATGLSGEEDAGADARLLQCKRLLPPKARVRLVVEAGVRSAGQAGQPGVPSRVGLAEDFEVRTAFNAVMSCTRTNAQAPCSPLFPILVAFSRPVPRDLAARVALDTPQGPRVARQFGPDGEDASSDAIETLQFDPPFAERSTLTLTLPDALRDDMGSPLANADRFPLTIPLDAMPPLAKFASGEFGIVERFVEGAPGQDRHALAPLALRRVESPLQTRDLVLSAGQVSDQVITDDVQALQWYARVKGLQEGSLTAGQFADRLALRVPREAQENERRIDVRSRSVFGPKDAVRTLTLPGVKDAAGQDIEMVGIPLAEPGLHVLEVASPRLGAALLKRAGASADEEIMHVRSAVLVTNLAVHLKTGRDDTLVWVTTLDRGQPVAGARVAVLNCDGQRLLDGETDAQGVWHADTPVPTDGYCEGTEQSGVFVTARIAADHPQAHGQADFSFAWSSWDRGIEPWRFNVPTSRSRDPDLVAHAVLDRTLLRVGETVSMKLFLRRLSRNGVENLPADRLPTQVRLSHEGSGDAETLALDWKTQPGGGQYALLDYTIPRKAHLGSYSIELQPSAGADDDWTPWLHAGDFRVESFKLPLLTGSLKIAGDEAQVGGTLVAPQSVRADLQLSWISGGPARDLPATLSAVARPLTPSFPEYDDFSFGVQRSGEDDAQSGNPESADAGAAGLRRLILDRHALTLDAQGGARVDLADLPRPSTPQSWLFEASFADPSGEIQTLAQTARVWPSAVVVGLRTGRWMSRGEKSSVTLLALDTAGQPQAGVPVQLDGRVRTTYSTRKRLVGGFYAYDSHEQVASLGTLCQGNTDAKGRLECPVSLDRDGQIELFAQARDAQSRVSRASTSIWVWGEESWFGEGNDDRIDVIPAKADYKPGETAEFTVRMPFRQARALVAVEREGVLETHVVDLDGDEPVVRLPVQAGWGPNVYVSVLAVRGRVRQVPWTSFFEWGWRHPLDWMDARAARSDTAPEATGLVDLAKPAFRFGLASIRVQSEADRLQVKVEADRSSYQVRQQARVRIQAMLPDGKPAAGAGVAFAAVDEALLELRDNDSWDLLRAMRVERDYGVETATGQGEVVGRRHYGRKAVAAGGGGGFNATRELFDTRLLWRGDLTLDAQGQATIEVPLNDSLTRFRLVAVVDQGQGMFGTGFTDIVSTQDLQVVSGLPQVAREGDRYEARATVRNRTDRPMALALSAGVAAAGGAEQALAGQTLRLEPGAAQTVVWPVTAPLLSGQSETEALKWRFEARTTEGEAASDRIVVGQTLLPAVPVTVRQATLLQIVDGVPQQVPVDASARALLDATGVPRGGVRVSLQSSLAGSLPGVRDWLSAYPYTCVEQLSAKAMGRRDPVAWQALMKRLPDYQTESGLLSYFPGGRGSVVLTAHMLEIATRAGASGDAYGLPGETREGMLAALQNYVFGRLAEDGWAPVRDDFWRKLIAVDALALAGAWQPGMLDSFALEVSDWPTAAVVTWLSILRHVPDLPDREVWSAQAEAVLRARLSRHGTTLVLADETVDSGWWLMSNPATAQARLLMTVLDRPAWRADLPRLLTGLLSMQRDGAWSTTTANVLGTLAVDQFARKTETHAGKGAVRVALSPGEPTVLSWADMPQTDGIRRQSLDLPWPQTRTGTLDIAQQGQGSGWATVAARAAVPVAQAVDAGLQVERTVVPVFKAQADRWSVGDVYRVRLRVRAREALVWSVVSDPVPAGASILGSGLGRDSSLATTGENQNDWNQPSFIEREAGVFRAYYEVMEPGERTLEYTVRLNVPGDYQLPPTRAEALYQPDVFGETPNTPLHAGPQP
ncbi:MAG: MG2 domain-containing protein [Castellaniella sp.]|uniref:alpha-2-macroglobulin family protein n=2 Tax=Castellaniella sp. TaxID=1955812 RepID=UPI003C778797